MKKAIGGSILSGLALDLSYHQAMTSYNVKNNKHVVKGVFMANNVKDTVSLKTQNALKKLPFGSK